ncbi:conserved lipothrix- and rudiviral protein [Sulfolobus islandicus filamentous virus 2]|uniref:Conserved lipothrix-and rudiviral protein n=1 Tax=Sulfolobus islandicus filamentous virus 2 TaxID=1902331 RepID=A0A1D8BJ87_SIFV|nr:conserved lipothrix- and rudiviral protein [Sulfolobus islandicus filamentous virus 2]
MVGRIIYTCPIDDKHILTLERDTREAKRGRCEHLFGYMISPIYSVKEDEVCPKEFRIKSWHVGGLIYGVCVSFRYVTRDKKELKKALEKLLNYPEDQIIYFILGDFSAYDIVDFVKSIVKDMFAHYKVGREEDDIVFNPKMITVTGVLNKVTIYLF